MIRRFLALVSLASLSIAIAAEASAAGVSVSASVESGVYDRVFEVRLTPSDPAAKLFYTFEPDGSPMDAYAYTGAIRVAASTPLLYFAFTSPSHESPIYRQDYELRYSTGVVLSVSPDDRIFSLSRPETDTGSIALDSWTLRKDGRILHEFAATDFLPAGAAFSASFDLPADISAYGTYDLAAPDESVAASWSVSEPKPQATLPVVASRPWSPPPRPAGQPSVDTSAPAISEMPSAIAVETGATSSGAVAGAPADMPPVPGVSASIAPEESATTRTQSTPDDTSVPSAGQPQPEPNGESSETPANTAPDVAASARTSGGLLPLTVLLALGLGALVWRFARRESPAARPR